jgi:citrate synthase
MNAPGTAEQLIARALHVAVGAVGPELAFGGIPEWDSMGHMQIMLLLESDYGLVLDAEVIPRLISVAAIRQHLEREGANPCPTSSP